jgi:hypothetical protein
MKQGARLGVNQRQAFGSSFAIDRSKELVRIAAQAGQVIDDCLWGDVAHPPFNLKMTR